MDKKINPNSFIIQSLQSEVSSATPFSRIPWFIKKFAITQENKEKIISILSSLGDKEIEHLDMRILKIKNPKNVFDPEMYNKILQIEWSQDEKWRPIYSKLIGLAKEIIASEMGVPVYEILKHIKADLGTWTIDSSEFDNPHDDLSESFSEEEKKLVEQEQQARIVMNALIMGAGHRIFDKVESDDKYPKAINKISPDLYQSYYDMVYTNLKYMRETKPANHSSGNTGSMKLVTEEKETKIKIQADIFPVLLHEMAKGVVEYMAYTRYNSLDPKITKSILSVDSRQSEHWMMLIGPQIYKQLFFLIKEAVAQYSDQKWLLDSKNAADYIVPVLAHILQMPAEKFLQFIENILREDQWGESPIALITKVIDGMHTQYEAYLASTPSPKMELTIEKIMEQLTRELALWKKAQMYIKSALPDVQYKLKDKWYVLSDKKLGRKIAEHYMANTKKFELSDFVDQTWVIELWDAISLFKTTRIEQAAFSIVHEQQKKFPKRTRTHDVENIYIHPRFPLSALEEAKKNIHPQVLEDIDNQVAELVQNWSISQWLQDHDTMNTTLSTLTKKYITLDDVIPDCLVEREDNRWLYELTNLEQLKREAGVMGWNCVAGSIDRVENGTLRVFSLRHWTQSHWTIWYVPQSQTINQVKWYIHQKKNAILTRDDPDYVQVVQAVNYLIAHFPVKAVNDMSNVGFNLTNKWFLSSADFIKAVNEWKLYSVTLLTQWARIYLSYEDIHILEKLSLRNIGFIDVQVWSFLIKYGVVNNKVETTFVDENINLNDLDHLSLSLESWNDVFTKIWPVTWCLLTMKKHPFFDAYDDYPVFWLPGLWDDRGLVQKGKKYGVVERDGESFKEILPCEYDEAPQFWLAGLEADEAVVIQDKKYGVIKLTESSFTVILSCEYDEIPQLQWLRAGEVWVKKYWTYGIIKKIDGEWKEILPCEYNSFPVFWTSGLASNEARVKHIDKLPFYSHNGYKFILIQRNGDEFTEKFSCEYNKAPAFWTPWLAANQAWVELWEDNNLRYGIIQKDWDVLKTVLDCRYDTPELLWMNWMKAVDENSFHEARVKRDWKYWVIKNIEGVWVEILPCKYTSLPTFWTNGRLNTTWGLAENEARVHDGSLRPFGDHYGILKREGCVFTEILPCEYDVASIFWAPWLADNEARVQKNKLYWIIRKENGICTEILPCEYQSTTLFEEDLLAEDTYVLQKEWHHCIVKKLPKFGTGIGKQIKMKRDGETCVWKQNHDGTWDEVSFKKYYRMYYGNVPSPESKWLRSDEILVQENNYWIVRDTGNWTFMEILPCVYLNLPRFWVHWLWPREAIADKVVDGESKYWIIKIHEDNTVEEILPFEYFRIIHVWPNSSYVIVEEFDRLEEVEMFNQYKKVEISITRDSVVKKNAQGKREKFFHKTYDEILQFAVIGLWTNESIVREKWELKLIRRDENEDVVVPSDYIMRDFGKFGLKEGEAWAKKKWGGMGIIKRDASGNIKELLPSYQAIGAFWESGLKDDEAIVRRSWNRNKWYFWIIKRTKNWFKEILPSKYYVIHPFGEDWIAPDEARVQEKEGGYYILIRRTEKWFKETGFSSYEKIKFDFGRYGLLLNESFLRADYRNNQDHLAAVGLVRKNVDGSYETLFSQDYYFEIKHERLGLLNNQYRMECEDVKGIEEDWDGYLHKIVTRNPDGSRSEQREVLRDKRRLFDGEYRIKKYDTERADWCTHRIRSRDFGNSSHNLRHTTDVKLSKNGYGSWNDYHLLEYADPYQKGVICKIIVEVDPRHNSSREPVEVDEVEFEKYCAREEKNFIDEELYRKEEWSLDEQEYFPQEIVY